MRDFLYRANFSTKEMIADNLIAFMIDDTPLLQETISFVHNWVMSDKAEKTKAYYDVWDIVLRKYLPVQRPILFRSCQRLSQRSIQSFTGKIYAAERFSESRKGHLLICDTAEYLRFEDENSSEHERSFFPLCECIKKGYLYPAKYFTKSFYDEYKKEDEYIVRVNQNWLYDLRWSKKAEDC